MIVKLGKNGATTEDIGGNIFSYDEDGFIFWPHRREKVKFITNGKDLYFLGTLKLSIREHWDALHWYKKQ